MISYAKIRFAASDVRHCRACDQLYPRLSIRADDFCEVARNERTHPSAGCYSNDLLRVEGSAPSLDRQRSLFHQPELVVKALTCCSQFITIPAPFEQRDAKRPFQRKHPPPQCWRAQFGNRGRSGETMGAGNSQKQP
jgi:hypothetical protein